MSTLVQTHALIVHVIPHGHTHTHKYTYKHVCMYVAFTQRLQRQRECEKVTREEELNLLSFCTTLQYRKSATGLYTLHGGCISLYPICFSTAMAQFDRALLDLCCVHYTTFLI